MPYAKADIANMALSIIGMSRQIADLDEASQEAATCKLWYPFALEEVLRSFAWPFAGKWAQLSLVSEEPNEDWAYEYGLPVDCVRARRLTGSGRTGRVSAFLIARGTTSGKSLYTDQPTPELEYTSRWDDPTVYDGQFASALAARLAMQIAMPIARDQGVAKAAQAAYTAALAAAAATASNEGEPDAPPPSHYVASRG